jgi:hypothetical protein
MGGDTYQINDDTTMSVFNYETNIPLNPNKVTWDEVKNNSQLYYSTKFELSPERYELINNGSTEFFNPNNKRLLTIKHDYQLSSLNRTFTGPVTNGPSVEGFGIGLSNELMKKLGLENGQIVYFNLF